jgi:heterodisulfide reductase subunit A
MYSLKFAHLLHEHTHARIYNFYIDMRCVGKGYEEFYDRLLNEGVRFVRGKVAGVTRDARDPSERGKLVVQAEDTLTGVIRRVPVDMVILANGLESQKDSGEVGRLFGISRNKAGFFIEQHPKLNPFGTSNNCIFIAGTCAGPKDIPQTVSQASAAASGAITLLSRGTALLEAVGAHINSDLCSKCLTCVSICPYQAISTDGEPQTVAVDETLCHGCGTCAAGCPAGAIEADNFNDEQILHEIEGLFSWEKAPEKETEAELAESGSPAK